MPDTEAAAAVAVPNPKTANFEKKKVDVKERRRLALELRLGGHTYQSIADQLGFASKGDAYNSIKSAIDGITREPAEQLLRVELERLDVMLRAIWPKVRTGDFQAIDRALKISERRAKLEGLDKPIRVDVAALVRQTAAELQLDDDEAAQLMTDIEGFMRAQAAAESGVD